MTVINTVSSLVVEDGIGILSINYPPVNALSQAVREGLVQGMRMANADPAIKAVVLICEGRTFLAGADITEFGKPPVAPFLPPRPAAGRRWHATPAAHRRGRASARDGHWRHPCRRC